MSSSKFANKYVSPSINVNATFYLREAFLFDIIFHICATSSASFFFCHANLKKKSTALVKFTVILTNFGDIWDQESGREGALESHRQAKALIWAK